MSIRKAEAVWEGTLLEGAGTMNSGSGAFQVKFSHATRFKDEPGSNPEELVGAAHAGCFSMFLSSLLTNEGYPPIRIRTIADVHLERDDIGPKITRIELTTEAEVPGIDLASFEDLAFKAKERCPVSRALEGVEIHVRAILV